MGKAKNIAIAGALVGGGLMGYGAWQDSECLRETVGIGAEDPNPFACMPEFEFGQKEPEADAHLGRLEVESEELTGSTMAMTFGEVTMMIGGDESKLDYDDDALTDFAGDVDATWYYNRGGEGATEVTYNPCVVVAEDYAEQVEHPQGVEGEGASPPQSEPGEMPQAGIRWEIETNEQGQPTGVTTNELVLDTCYMRVPNTPNNQLLDEPDEDNQTSEFRHQLATFRWMNTERITAFALASACPEAVVDIEAVESQLSEVVLGDVIAENPGMANVFSQLHEAGEFDINLSPPDVRREHYLQQLQETQDEIAGMDRSFPNEEQDGETYPMDVQLGELTVESCAQTQEVTIEAAGE